MSEESPNEKSIRLNRIVMLILLLTIVGGLVWAFNTKNDIIAAVTCFVGGIVFGILGRDDKNPFNGIGIGIVAGAGLMFLYMVVQFFIAS